MVEYRIEKADFLNLAKISEICGYNGHIQEAYIEDNDLMVRISSYGFRCGCEGVASYVKYPNLVNIMEELLKEGIEPNTASFDMIDVLNENLKTIRIEIDCLNSAILNSVSDENVDDFEKLYRQKKALENIIYRLNKKGQ